MEKNRRADNLSTLLLIAIGLIQFLIAIKISHPPTEEQLKILLPILKINSTHPSYFLWGLRTVSYFLLFFSLINFYRLSRKYFSSEIPLLASLAIHLSPTFFSLWFLHPINSLAIFVFTFLFKKYHYKKENLSATKKAVCAIIFVFALLIMNTGLDIKRAPLIESLNLREAQQKVIERFTKEDSLKERIKFPLVFRKISYNKYFFTYKNTVKKIIDFFDLESIFFQEVHPLGQKSFVIFFWPELILFILGLYWLVNSSAAGTKSYISFLTITAFLGFITMPGEIYKRFSLLLFPFSLIIASGIKTIKPTVLKMTALLIILYSAITNYYSLVKNYNFWFNNREIAYNFIFNSLNQIDLEKYKRIHITGLIGNAKAYCYYYLKQCDDGRFSFDSFDLTSNLPKSGEIYAGFIGEFIGKRLDNVFLPTDVEKIREKSLTPLYQIELRDSVAFQYGHLVIVAEKK